MGNRNRLFKTVIGADAAYILGMRKEMNDRQWERESPLIKDLHW
jgi:hypothetical protein